MTVPDVSNSISPIVTLGLGLIGGSLLRAAAPLAPVAGWSPTLESREAARSAGFTIFDTVDDAIAHAADTDALLVLAAPVTAFDVLLDRVAEVAPAVKLTDVGSVKAVVFEQVRQRCPDARYIGSHPMAGTAFSGWAAGSATLFQDAAWVTCLDEDSDLGVWTDVARLALAIGSRVVPVEAAAHDDAVARISHLPHLLALALAQVAEAGGALPLALAASSFADGTRVAGTRPELIRAMCEANRPALVGAMDEFLGLLGVARGSLSSTGSLQKLTAGGHDARLAFERRDEGLTRLTLRGDDLVDQLLSVGSAGGYVTGLIGSDPDLQVEVCYPDED